MREMRLVLITLLMFISIFSIGFASWIITEPEISYSSNSIRVDNAVNEQFVLFGNKKDEVLKYTKNGFVKDVIITKDDEGNDVVNYVERNKITIPTTIEIDKFKLAFDPNNENESLVLKVRLTLKLTDELQSMDLTKHSLFWNEGQEERDRFISVQCLPSEGFENAKQSGDPVITYLPEGIQIDLKFDLKTNNETTLEKYKDHKYDLVFTFDGSKMRYYHYYETNEKGDITSKIYNFFTAADSPLTNVDADEDGGSHIFDIQSLLTVNPD